MDSFYHVFSSSLPLWKYPEYSSSCDCGAERQPVTCASGPSAEQLPAQGRRRKTEKVRRRERRRGEREEMEPCQRKKSREPEVSDNVRRRGRNGVLEKCEAAGWEAEMEIALPRPVRRPGMK